jgi:hypothetical protein
MTDQQAGGESRARCDAPHTKAKGPYNPFAESIKSWAELLGPPVLQPGTKVRYRIPPKDCDRQDEGPFVITGVITERGMHGTSVRYRIGNGDIDGDGWEIAPELVEPVKEVNEAELLEAIDRSSTAPLEAMPVNVRERCPVSGSYELVAFNEIAPNLMESECGRFRVTFAADRWSAFDTWTGETSPASPERVPALKWVARRAVAPVPSLNWTDFVGGARVHHMGTTFEVFQLFGPKWKGYDPRFTSEAFRSPLLGTLEQAKAWCAVRAMCEAAPLPSGNGTRPQLVV